MRYPAVLCIVTLLIAGSAAGKASVELDKRKDTIERMEIIKKAMDAFSAAYGRVPCPADSSLTINNTNFGKELLSGTDCGSDTGRNTGDIMSGTVPVRTLSLPDTLMFDGWGRRMLYVVDQRFSGKGQFQQDLTNAGITDLTSYNFTAQSTIEIRNTISGATLNSGATDRTIGVLISYGQNGNGAYTRQGTMLGNGTDVDELENNQGTMFNAIFIKKELTSSFDDVLLTIDRNSNIALHCLGVDVPSKAGGHTPAGNGYPAYDWPNSGAGTTETKTCSTEYTGTVTRVCDTNAQWQPIVSTCNCAAATLTDNASYLGTWPKGDDIGTVIGDSHTLTEVDDDVCQFTFNGDVTAQCQPAGGWVATTNNCGP